MYGVVRTGFSDITATSLSPVTFEMSPRSAIFATANELRERTGLVSGDVPPFGEPILPFQLYADESVFENERIAFNAGSLTDSIVMQVADWERVARPTRLRFSREI